MAKGENSTISTQITPETHKVLERLLGGSGMLGGLAKSGIHLSKSTVIRCGILMFLQSTNAVEKEPGIILRGMTPESFETALRELSKEAQK